MAIGNNGFYVVAYPSNSLGDMEALTLPDDKRRALQFRSKIDAINYVAKLPGALANWRIVYIPG